MLDQEPVSARETITLTGAGLTVDDVCAVARERAPVDIAPEALRRVREARDVVDRVLASGEHGRRDHWPAPCVLSKCSLLAFAC